MILEEIEKSKFSQINNKRYSFSNDIVSLPFSDPVLTNINKFKREKCKNLNVFYWQKCTVLFKNYAVEENKRIPLYRSILQQKPAFYQLNYLKKSVENNQKINFHKTPEGTWFLDMSYCFEATFSDNILVLDQAECGKTSFVQNLGKNKIVGEGLLRADWVSKIDLTKEKEDQIR